MCGGPATTEFLILLMAALRAGPVSSRKRGRLVEEEEFSVGSGLHDRAVPVVELQATHQPSTTLTVSHDALLRVMEDTSISEHLTSLRHGNKVAKRSNTVLPWHQGLLPLSSIDCNLLSDAP
jgi:hypothetical protein